MKKKLIVICGPTAIGKTEVAVKIARHFNCEIISADSRQFYIETNAGTAKPDATQLSEVKHHLINSLHITEDYSAGKFEHDCLNLLEQLFLKNNFAVMVGGSGLYIDAVLYGIDVPQSDASVRKMLEEEFNSNGLSALQERLKQLDPVYFETNDIQNSQRMMRAIEVSMITGKPFSSFLNKKPAVRNFEIILIGLNTNRELLYQRINKRVDTMISNGLKQECELLFGRRSLNALQTVGYKEMFAHLEGKINFDEAVNLIKQHTRNYAKRQLTWFRRYESMNWFEPEQMSEMIRLIEIERKGER